MRRSYSSWRMGLWSCVSSTGCACRESEARSRARREREGERASERERERRASERDGQRERDGGGKLPRTEDTPEHARTTLPSTTEP
eukprot:1969478-Rhodomonas_salina.1